MDETKPIWKSKSIVGSVIVMLGMILNMTGVVERPLGPDEQSTLIDMIANFIDEGMVVLGAIMGAYGRMVAKTTLTLKG